MAEKFIINNFKEIQVTKPVDIIINQIRELITSGQLQPGDKLPSERKLSEKLNIGRTHVRDAIRKLEFYGILKTLPQKGTVVTGIGIAALESLITDILQLEKSDFKSLVETRVILEIEAARLASERRTAKDLNEIDKSLKKYAESIDLNKPAVEEDMLFHIKIVEASQNSVLKSLMLIIIPDMLSNYNKYKVCYKDRLKTRYEEHKLLFESIKQQDSKKAVIIMKQHLKDILILGDNIQP